MNAPVNPIKKSTNSNDIPSFLCTIEGWKTKIKNLHWAAPDMNTHKLLDEIADFVGDFQDALAEDYMGLTSKFGPSFLKGTPCSCSNTKSLLKDMSDKTKAFYESIPEDTAYSGITSETDTFIHNINKYTYLIGLC